MRIDDVLIHLHYEHKAKAIVLATIYSPADWRVFNFGDTDMPEKDPTTYSLLTYGWVLMLSLFGGVVHYIKKVRDNVTSRFNLSELVGDLLTSAFAGVITFYLCEAGEINKMATASLVGVSGHMGSRAIFIFETYLKKRFGG